MRLGKGYFKDMLCKNEKVHYVVIESYKMYEVLLYYQAALGFALVKNFMAAHSHCGHQQRQCQSMAGFAVRAAVLTGAGML